MKSGIDKTGGRHYSYFQNSKCEYFPCHQGADRDNFNCLFCYCPLYILGPDCGGNFRYTDGGRKDCTNCLFPHRRENYTRVTGRYQDIAAQMNACLERSDGKEDKI